MQHDLIICQKAILASPRNSQCRRDILFSNSKKSKSSDSRRLGLRIANSRCHLSTTHNRSLISRNPDRHRTSCKELRHLLPRFEVSSKIRAARILSKLTFSLGEKSMKYYLLFGNDWIDEAYHHGVR